MGMDGYESQTETSGVLELVYHSEIKDYKFCTNYNTYKGHVTIVTCNKGSPLHPN